MKQITFNGITTTIHQNADGLYSLTGISQAWVQSGGTGGQLEHWKRTSDVVTMIETCEIRIISSRGRNRETWGCNRAVVLFASYCSTAFQLAVVDAFTALTKGNVLEAAAIAEAITVSPELIEKHDATRKAVNTILQEKGVTMSGHAFGNFYRLACKAATGYTPSMLTGKNGSAKDYLKNVDHAPGMAALIAAMESIIMGLRVGLDYHKIAAMLNVETTKNVDYFG